MVDLLWLVPALPLAGTVINALFGRRLGKPLSGLIAVLAVFAAFVVAALAVTSYVAGDTTHPHQLHLFPWIAWGEGATETMVAEAGLMLDPLSSVMVLVITGVGSLIHLYSLGYMSHDPGYPRFFTYLNLFTFSMLTLVLANNFLLMFVGWELVGLCSYLLIGFWFTRPSAASAGKKAFVVNRVGDWGFLIGLFLIWATFGTFQFFGEGAGLGGVLDDPGGILKNGGSALDLSGFFWGADYSGQWVLPVSLAIALLLLVGATGKSAQIPLYVWLPDAMEGPTPVSALIHAATMVTAGVYMIARAHSLYELAPEALTVVATIGALTAIFAATIALVQNDIKRVLAYSTVSQLGYMFLGLGTGAFATGIFHLMTHAFFKALLFLGAGSVIHGLSDEQDLRKMGGLFRYMRVTTITFLIGWLAIIGTPGFSGFFSKDLILAKTFERAQEDPFFYVHYLLGIVTVGLTAFYMSRLVFLAFFGRYRGEIAGHAPATAAAAPEHEPVAAAAAHSEQAAHGTAHTAPAHDEAHTPAAGHGAHDTPGGHAGVPHESPASMLIPLVVLAFLSIVGGLWPLSGMPGFITGDHAETQFEQFLAPSVTSHTGGATHEAALDPSVEWGLTAASVGIAALGGLVAAAMYLGGRPRPSDLVDLFGAPYRWLSNKWYVDELYQALIAHPGARLAAFLSAFDLGVIDGAVNGVAKLARGTGGLFRRLQTGYVRGYAVTFVVGAFAVLAYWAFRP
ncbi:MAG TPA: NADH-quinone oxidoreductase subunit L [Chloroflexota bacterium]|nr:NADH-quinone oxidoreductase subunit L [Chloroflexota bacterium]